MPSFDLFSYPGYDTTQYWLKVAKQAYSSTPQQEITHEYNADHSELLFTLGSTNLTWQTTNELRQKLNDLPCVKETMAIHRHRPDQTFVMIKPVEQSDHVTVQQIEHVLSGYLAR